MNSCTDVFNCLSTFAEHLFLLNFPMVDSAFVVLGKRRCSDAIQLNCCELQSQCSPLEFVFIIVGWLIELTRKAIEFKFLGLNCWEIIQLT